MRVALAQQILRLMDFVCSIDRNKHSADLRRRPEGNVPLGNVGRPDRHVIARLDAHGNQRPRKGVHVVAKLAVGAGIVQRGIAECVLIRKLLHHSVQYLRERQVDDMLLGPHIFSRTALVFYEPAPGILISQIPGHVIGIMGEHNARIGQVRIVVSYPLYRHILFIVDRAQRQHSAVYGQVALAHQPVFRLAILHHRVFGVDMLNISAKILHGLLRRLTEESVRMVHIPQRRHIIAGNLRQQIRQPLCIRIHAVRLHKQRHPRLFRMGGKVPERLLNYFVVYLAVYVRITIRQYSDIRRGKFFRQVNIFPQLTICLLCLFRIAQRAAGGQTADL